MNTEQLYIDNELVDLDTDTKVTLSIKSNLLQDISKIVSNNTYTIKLPKTVRNNRIFEHADLAQAEGRFQYSIHKARFFRNGVEIIKDGRAVLMETKDNYEISIAWGLFPAFSDIVANGTTLNQLQSDARLRYWKKNNTDELLTDYETAMASDYFYAYYDPWIKEEKEIAEGWEADVSLFSDWDLDFSYLPGVLPAGGPGEYIHPLVKVTWLLELVKEQLGVDFVWNGDAKKYIDTLVIPLISNKANELSYETSEVFRAKLLPTTSLGALRMDIKSGGPVTSTTGIYDGVQIEADAKLQITVICKFISNGRLWAYEYSPVVRMFVKEDEFYKVGEAIPLLPGSLNYMRGRGIVNVTAGNMLSFRLLSDEEPVISDFQFLGGDVTMTAITDGVVPDGGYFPIASNLPNIKIIDLIKFLAAVTGTFPQQITQDGIVSFVPYERLWDNVSSAVDWTSKLVAQSSSNKPKEVAYKLSDWAQNNRYRWKEDDTVTGNYDGNLFIGNDTLDYSKDIITFPFAATDGNNVPTYQKKTNSDGTEEVKYKACKDRIMRLRDVTLTSPSGESYRQLGLFFDMNMQNIINEKYGHLSATLNNLKIIKERFMLSDIEVQRFDDTRPVYLAQYGRYFAVTEIKSSESGVADVTLLQLYL